MRDITVGIYDDAPAGFRLLYKHGRSNPALWSMIYDVEQFVLFLREFFLAMEVEIGHSEDIQDYRDDYIELTTSIIRLIQSPEFIDHAFYRLARHAKEAIFKEPLKHLHKIHRKPWAYISGGTMDNLISCYYKLGRKPKEKSRWVESPNELFAFLIDSIKEMDFSSPKDLKGKSFLMFSPTHAFRLIPSLDPFCRAWESRQYTYTWIRDNLIIPRINAVHNVIVDRQIADAFYNYLVQKGNCFTKNITSHLPTIYGSRSLTEFRQELLKCHIFKKHSQINSDHNLEILIDSYLYSFFPVFRRDRAKDYLTELFSVIESIEVNKKHNLQNNLISFIDKSRWDVVGALPLLELICSMIIIEEGRSTMAHDIASEIVLHMQNIGLAFPRPIFFADTNWVNNYFAFVVNPGNAELELWRVNRFGLEGSPMRSWKQWLNGSSHKKWGVFYDAMEYRA